MEWLANKLLASPAAYDFSQWLVGARHCHARFMSEMVRPVFGERVLDIGCGVGACLTDVPDGVEYVGIDCGETPEGKLLIFEVDSGMTVHAMDGVDVFPYKQVQMKKVFRTFREMLEARLSRP